MKKSRVLLIGQYFYPEKISSGVLPYELAVELANNGYDVSALVGFPKEYIDINNQCKKKECVNGIKIKRMSYIQAKRKNVIGRIVNILSFTVSVFFHPMCFKKTDVCISFTNPPLLPFIVSIYCRLFKKKHMVVLYDLYPDVAVKLGMFGEKSVLSKVFDKVNLFVYKYCDRIIAISNEMKAYLVNYKGVDEAKIVVIHNWYQNLYEANNYSISIPIKVMYGGNMGKAQDMQTILDIVLSMKNDERFEFLFIGHGSDKEEIKESIEKNKLVNCKMFDFLPKEEYDKMLETAHIAMLSIKDEILGLGSPSKYYGYLALKKPIIAVVPNDSDIANDIEIKKNGIHIMSGDIVKAKKFLTEIAEDESRLIEMSKKSFELFKEKYTVEISANKFIEEIDYIINKK